MTRGPDFHELVGDEGTPEELERLRQVHELLVAAGPPPELPHSLAEPPRMPTREPRRLWPRYRLQAGLAFAAVLAFAAFGIGYLVGGRGDSFEQIAVVPMHASTGASATGASIEVGPDDGSGNWPLELTVWGLPAAPKGSWYELSLTKGGEIAESCGTFNVGPKRTTVTMNVPYDLRSYDGWVVTAHRPGAKQAQVLLTT